MLMFFHHSLKCHFGVAVSCALAASIAVGKANASPILSDDFDTDTSGNYAVISSGDTTQQFAFDYSVHGIPPAPGSATTRGLKLQAHLLPNTAVHAVTVVNRQMITDEQPGYRVRFHAWQNFRFAGGGPTQFLSAGVGHDGVTNNFAGNAGVTGPTPETGAGAWFAASCDRGAFNDYIAFKDGIAQSPNPPPSPYFAPDSELLPAQSGNIPYYTDAFPPVTLSSINGGALVTAQQQSGTTFPGVLGFAWRLWQLDVVAGTATWSIDGLPIARLDGSANGGVSTSGMLTFGYMDIFNSASASPARQFALIDNLSVTSLPEPGGLLWGLTVLVVGRRVRRYA